MRMNERFRCTKKHKNKFQTIWDAKLHFEILWCKGKW